MRTLIIACIFCLPGLAFAQNADFTADDIVKHFQRSQQGEQPQAKRGVVIGAAGFGNSEGSVQAPKTGTVGKTGATDAYNLLITFEFNSDSLTPRARNNLDQFIQALQTPDLSRLRFSVDGHTDAAGSDAYNLTLSTRRADSVVRYLTERGITRTRLRARGYGESNPVNSDPNHPDNRRVEARLLE